MARVLRSLRSSQPVARFQRLCGLFPAKDEGAGDGLAGTAAGGNHFPTRDTCLGGSPARQRLREANGVKSSPKSQDYAQKYVVKNYFYYYLFKFSSALGEEIFYITFLPFTYWNIDRDVSRRLIMMWCVWAFRQIFQARLLDGKFCRHVGSAGMDFTSRNSEDSCETGKTFL